MTWLWLPRRPILEPRAALAAPHARVSGRYCIHGRRADGRTRVITPWRPNLVLDTGLDRRGTGPVITHCVLGSGTTAPAVTDTALETWVAAATVLLDDLGAQTEAPYYGWRIGVATFTPPGVLTTVAELGWGWLADGTGLFSRVLATDGSGTPQAFDWLPDESLTVTHELRVYPWGEDGSDTMVLNGAGYDCTLRVAKVTAPAYWKGRYKRAQLWENAQTAVPPRVYSGGLGAVTGLPTGDSADASAQTSDAYVSGSYERTGSATWDPGVGAFAGGVAALLVCAGSAGSYQVGFDPPLPHTAETTLALTVASPTWGRL